MQSTKPNCSVLSLTFTSLIFLSYIDTSFSVDLCNPSDKNTLLQIKSHFNNASPFTTWHPDRDCCVTWSVVECDTHGRVTTLAFDFSDDVVGEIPPVIGNLPFLQVLVLSNMPQWRYPSDIIKINSHLNFLDFSGLTFIDLSENSFSGPIPSSLGQLNKLQSVNLGSNQLSGPIPASLGRIKTLTHLYLYINNLTGPLPSSLGSLPNLNELGIYQNKLTGSIPPNFANITAINLSNNRLTGDASFMFGSKKTAFTLINLSNNRFKFDFSKTGLPPGLKNLDISHNMIYGSLPKNIGQLPLMRIDVSFNQLCGQIPTGRRLKQFSANKFSNNKCLCGLPLPACN
ncbi:hypothetical protein RND81_14G052500 [Saponaria officinalis]|uniref:Leucine-rich repeat-containing N-terminal plant-type domain-containing protein n=1 Tax=Saponaria officinalis TaxID=3572 RepID=A0AAW1GLN8_SAPOF